MQLLIEAGNTYVKVALLTKDEQIEQIGKYPSQKLELVLQPLLEGDIERIVFASVGPVEVDNTIQRIAQLANIPVIQVKTAREDFGVTNAYKEYQYLGIDRWLTLVAIHKHFNQPTVIVDIGTALTFDVMSETGQHLGGWIVPGYQLMMKSVLDNTTKVFSDHDHSESLALADNTADGLKNGCRAALVGLIEFGLKQAEKELRQSPEVILCGGGVRHLPKDWCAAFHHRSELVLEGLALYAKQR
ncbi:type III pantothenate kinase [Photobacterium lucens]|uniref:type III pantothenate kinase n=1 Tax=Photobacterium lucens TaxID=2562949 RepID=UPI00136FFDA5|nr:type III pantothenate kinase [Photobacterium lucens]MBP2698696.1 type III pantothenate kinase [Vibrio parahaemolyticus]MZG55232.1 type III pantothenate kinase [Photobacterium lucens]MZG79927.1 type III pantothenate kinase [Photobacterium lucens]